MNKSLKLRFYPYSANPPARDVGSTDSVSAGGDHQGDSEILGFIPGGSIDLPLLTRSVEGSDDGRNWETTSSIEIVDITAALLRASVQATLKVNLKTAPE